MFCADSDSANEHGKMAKRRNCELAAKCEVAQSPCIATTKHDKSQTQQHHEALDSSAIPRDVGQ
eukprot:8450875-Alexandrium_andersonii.AAC.1